MISMVYNNKTQLSDLERDGGNILTDEGLYTAVLLSLFTRRQALPDDELPVQNGLRGGYWGDSYPDVEGDFIGSRLWLLGRSKTTQDTVNQATSYAQEALQWMVDDGIASDVTAEAERHAEGVLAFRVRITKGTDTASSWEWVWQVHLDDL